MVVRSELEERLIASTLRTSHHNESFIVSSTALLTTSSFVSIRMADILTRLT